MAQPQATQNAPTSKPPAKRRRLTPAEKASKAEEDARKKQEKEEVKRQKLAEKAKAEQEKADARAAKQAEKTKREVEEADKRRKKEEEDRKAHEEKERKQRSQLKLNKFFTKVPAKAPTTPKKAAIATDGTNGTEETASKVAVADASPIQETKSVYDKMFQPFFVKENVSLALNVIDLDPETKEAKARILDEYVSGKRGTYVAVQPFRPTEAFRLISGPRRRGYIDPPVKELIEQLQTSDSAKAREALKKVTMKQLSFKQDVRPAYCGTVTRHQHAAGEAKMHRLARCPKARILDLQYDYDSEAEWQDDEQGEDLDDADDDEEEDGDDDMDGFLDDSEDAGLARRLFNNGGEPESTGICFEGGRKRTGELPKTYLHRLEFIHRKFASPVCLSLLPVTRAWSLT
jgi:chromatin assembly factor 1 subunit A